MFAWLIGLTCKECGVNYYKEDGYNSKFCSLDCKWEYNDRKREKQWQKEEKARIREEKARREREDDNRIKSEIASF